MLHHILETRGRLAIALRMERIEHIAHVQRLARRIRTLEDLADHVLVVDVHHVGRHLVLAKRLPHTERQPYMLRCERPALLVDPRQELLRIDHAIERQVGRRCTSLYGRHHALFCEIKVEVELVPPRPTSRTTIEQR